MIVTAEDVERHKPDPTPVLLELLEVEAASAVFMGDSPQDLIAGRAARVETAAVLWEPFSRQVLEAHGPNYWLNCPDEIATLGVA